MSIYSNENSSKIMKLSPREFLHLVQNRENICTRKLWRIQYLESTLHTLVVAMSDKLSGCQEQPLLKWYA